MPTSPLKLREPTRNHDLFPLIPLGTRNQEVTTPHRCLARAFAWVRRQALGSNGHRLMALLGSVGLAVMLGLVPARAAMLSEVASQSTPYRMLVGLPEVAVGQRLPLVLWLHGFSLRGDDLSRLTQYGPVSAWPVGQQPYILVAPQLPKTRLLWDSRELEKLVDELAARYPVDPKRQVLMGASLGAAAAWRLAARMPGRFSTVINVAGAGATSDIRKAQVQAARFFHGEQDRQVPLEKVQEGVDLLTQAGADVTLQIFPGVGHTPEVFNTRVFSDAGLYAWVFSRSAGPAAPKTAGSAAPVDLMETVRALSAFGHRRPGSPQGVAAEEWIAARMAALGLQVQRQPIDIRVWTPTATTLQIDGARVPASFVANTAFTGAQGVAAPLLYAGKGHASDFRGLEVRGKLVVVEADIKPSGGRYRASGAHAVFDAAGELNDVVWDAHFPSNILGGFIPGVAQEGEAEGLIGRVAERRDALLNAQRLGAAGLIVLLPTACGMDSSAYWPYDALPKDIPGAYVDAAHADRVRQAAQRAAPAQLVLEGQTVAGQMSNLWALLPGQSEEAVLVTSHHDSPHQGAVEDATGVAQVLAQAAHWSALPMSQRPKSLVFVLAAGHFYKGEGGAAFVRAHPALMAKVRGMVTVEHVAAREFKPQGGRSGQLVPTGRPQRSVVYVPQDKALVQKLVAALQKAPQPRLTVESPWFNGVPFTDAAGFVAAMKEVGRKLPYASWISAPCYLITDSDTPDKVDASRLPQAQATVTELVKAFMAD